MQDVGGPRCAEDGPLDAPVFEIAAVDLVGAEPLFDALLDAVCLGETDGAGTRWETVVHKVHRILKKRWWRAKGAGEENFNLMKIF